MERLSITEADRPKSEDKDKQMLSKHSPINAEEFEVGIRIFSCIIDKIITAVYFGATKYSHLDK